MNIKSILYINGIRQMILIAFRILLLFFSKKKNPSPSLPFSLSFFHVLRISKADDAARCRCQVSEHRCENKTLMNISQRDERESMDNYLLCVQIGKATNLVWMWSQTTQNNTSYFFFVCCKLCVFAEEFRKSP